MALKIEVSFEPPLSDFIEGHEMHQELIDLMSSRGMDLVSVDERRDSSRDNSDCTYLFDEKTIPSFGKPQKNLRKYPFIQDNTLDDIEWILTQKGYRVPYNIDLSERAHDVIKVGVKKSESYK